MKKGKNMKKAKNIEKAPEKAEVDQDDLMS